VISNSLARITTLVLFIAVSASMAGAWPHKHGHKVRVRFLATGTLVRGTWGQNEDTYLAELSLSHDTESVLVRMVDAYPNEAPPLSHAVLTSNSGTVLRVRRDSECDRPYAQMLLRTAPGDPMAILRERLNYVPQLDRTMDPKALLPCYRIAR
jgi:hypothetical protein